MRVLSIVMLVLWVCSAAAAEDALAQEDTATLWAALRAGGHVALVRHGATAGGAGDPPGSELDDCATQRNLNDKGRAEAPPLASSSRWSRCRWQAHEFAMVSVPRDGGLDGPWSGRTLRDLQQRLHVA